jgi:8-oxo-dGTP pyrophosphatase MutT (NUDIX family)
MPDNRTVRPARTLLEQLIRERVQTYDEFVSYAEKFAREHGEAGTISVRHLQRLAVGRRSDGQPLGPVRPATARLLERIFDHEIAALIGPPPEPAGERPGPQPLRVAIAVVVRDREVLVVRRRDALGKGVSWQFPTGIIKPGAVAADVAIRETLAETGVHSVVVRDLGSRQHPVTNVLCDYLLCGYLAGEAANLDLSENTGVTWIDCSRLANAIPEHRIYKPVLAALGTTHV